MAENEQSIRSEPSLEPRESLQNAGGPFITLSGHGRERAAQPCPANRKEQAP